jgi:hypothetical protein
LIEAVSMVAVAAAEKKAEVKEIEYILVNEI